MPRQQPRSTWSDDRRYRHDLRRALDRVADDVVALAGARALRGPDLAGGGTSSAGADGDVFEVIAPLVWILRDVVGVDDLRLRAVGDVSDAVHVAPVVVDGEWRPVAVLTCGAAADGSDRSAMLERAAIAAGDLVAAARRGEPTPFERVRSTRYRSSIPFERRQVVDVAALAAHLRPLVTLGEDHEVEVEGELTLWTDRPALTTLLEHLVALAVRRSEPASSTRVVLGPRSIVVEGRPPGVPRRGADRRASRPAAHRTARGPEAAPTDSLSRRRIVRECASRLGAHVQDRVAPDGGRSVTVTMPVHALV